MLDALLAIEFTVGGLLWAVVLYVLPTYFVYRKYIKKALDNRRAAQIDTHFQVAKDAAKIVDNFQVVGKKKEPTLDDIPQMVKEMRDSFDAGLSRPIQKRLEQLKALRKLFSDNQKAIEAAIKSDLGRPTWECHYYDIFLPMSEIDYLIHNLPRLVQPHSKGFNILTFPSTNEIYKEPLGVVLVIGTWNYPIMLSLVPVAGAIAAGNTVILKPSNISGSCAKLLAELIPKYMDPAILSVVGTAMQGDRATTSALLDHKFDHIFFTGSPSVGKVVMQGAAKHLTPVTLELGGKNPVFVDQDANLSLAAKRTVWGRMMNAGQQCISPDYVLVHRNVADEFQKQCAFWAENMYAKNASGGKSSPKENGNLGRIVGDRQMQRLASVLQDHGGRVVYGGNLDMESRYIEPTVLQVDLNSPSMREETFGPILLVVPVDSMQQAIRYVQSRPKPLSMYVFAADRRTQEEIIYNTSAGGVTVNGTLFHVAHPELPFGGVGDSGIGRYHGEETFNTFTHEKPVLRKAIWSDGGMLSDPFFIYPPWSDAKVKLMKLLATLAG